MEKSSTAKSMLPDWTTEMPMAFRSGSRRLARCGGGVHPLRVHAGDGGTLRDIFGDRAEAGTSLARTVLHGRFAGKLVRELVHLGHAQGVLMGSGGQRGIPSQSRQAGGGAIAIGGVKQSLVGGAGLRRRSVATRE